jgi:hypothetical protein
MTAARTPALVLSFQNLHSSKRLEFPCDEKGIVLFEALTERARNNYFYARAMLGREYLTPKVQQV